MQKCILITGSTDGIGLETASMLVSMGQYVLLHGRNPSRLERAEKALSALPGDGRVESFVADLSLLANVEALARAVLKSTLEPGCADQQCRRPWRARSGDAKRS